MKEVADGKFHVLFHIRQFTGILRRWGTMVVTTRLMMSIMVGACPFLLGPKGVFWNLVFMIRIFVGRPRSRAEIPNLSRGILFVG